jgi:acyl-CoA thioester hydrolase
MVRTSDGEVVARARIKIVAVSPEQTSVGIPDLLRQHLDAWAQGARLTPTEAIS